MTNGEPEYRVESTWSCCGATVETVAHGDPANAQPAEPLHAPDCPHGNVTADPEKQGG